MGAPDGPKAAHGCPQTAPDGSKKREAGLRRPPSMAMGCHTHPPPLRPASTTKRPPGRTPYAKPQLGTQSPLGKLRIEDGQLPGRRTDDLPPLLSSPPPSPSPPPQPSPSCLPSSSSTQLPLRKSLENASGRPRALLPHPSHPPQDGPRARAAVRRRDCTGIHAIPSRWCPKAPLERGVGGSIPKP